MAHEHPLQKSAIFTHSYVRFMTKGGSRCQGRFSFTKGLTGLFTKSVCPHARKKTHRVATVGFWLLTLNWLAPTSN
jgi:hypothetical protein